MGSAKSGSRNVPQNVELSREFLYQNYREAIARMFDQGVCGKTAALSMLDRVEKLVGKDVE